MQEWETPCPSVEVGNATTLPAILNPLNPTILNAADKEEPSTKTPIINTAAGPSTQSESDCTGSGCIITTGGVAAPRDGAGDVKYIPGRK